MDELPALKQHAPSIVELAESSIFVLDGELHVSAANRWAERTYGYTRTQMIGRPASLLSISSERPRFRAAVARAIEQGATVFDTVHRNKAGDQIPVVVWLTSALLEDQRFVYMTARRQSEFELRHPKDAANDLRYRRLFESAKDGILIVDYDSGLIDDVNPFLIDLLGYTYDEYLGRHLWDVPPLRRIAESAAAFERLRDAGYLVHDDLQLETKSGSTRDVEFVSNVYSVGVDRVIQCNIRDCSARKRTEQSNRRLAAIVDSADDAIMSTSATGVIQTWNAGATALLGYSAAESIGRNAGMLIPADLHIEEHAISERVRHEQRVQRYQTRRVRKDGTQIAVSLTKSPIRGSHGDIVGVSTIMRDITERKQVEERLRRLHRVSTVLSDINSLVVRVRDRHEVYRETCRIAVEVGRFSKAWIGIIEDDPRRMSLVAARGSDLNYLKNVEEELKGAIFTTGSAQYDEVMIKQAAMICNDVEHDERLSLRAKAVISGTRSLVWLPLVVERALVGVLVLHASERDFFDDEEMKLLNELAGDVSFALGHLAQQEQINYLAFYDSLTGLANRALFLERLEQGVQAAARSQTTIAVVITDIDRFKNINDTFGRHAGDELLRQIGRRISAAATDKDRVARTASDQFATLMYDMRNDGDIARHIEAGIRSCFMPPFDIAETQLRVSAKVGIALYPEDGGDADTLLKHAEAALKLAKNSDEIYLFYRKEMTERVAEQLAMENRLRRALENDEFVLYYQPKVDVDTLRLVGVEALIRWSSPELGLLPPMRFIPLMEETGGIVEVGIWALQRAALDRRRWLESGLAAPRIAVNVSAAQLRRSDFVASVREALSGGSIPAGIDIEITESLMMDDIDGNVEKLRALREMGVNLAIDDFGTGYSSLAYLAKLPAQSLKIDRTFIMAMLTDADKMTLVATMIGLAHSLRLKVVAEGVETEDEAKMLRLLHCDQMQGYLISKAVPFDEMATIIARGTPLSTR